jgi:hypothetical protein
MQEYLIIHIICLLINMLIISITSGIYGDDERVQTSLILFFWLSFIMAPIITILVLGTLIRKMIKGK